MNKRLKVLASTLALTAVLASSILAGCGSKSNNSSKAESGSKEKTITVWSHLTEQEVKEVDKKAQEWGKKNKVKVKVVHDQGDWQAFIQAANSSKGPDIMFGVAHDNLGTFQKANLLAEVPEDVIKNEDYVENSIKAVTIEGKKYAVPLAVETYGLFYNTDKVKEAPKTFDDFMENAKKTGFKYDINNIYFSYAFLAANGGYVFKDKDGTLDPKDIGLGNEGAIKGYKILQDFVQKDKLMTADIKGDMAKGEFQNGKAGLYISGPWDVQGFKDANVKFKVSPLPEVNGKPMPSFVGVQTALVNAKSKNQKEAWELMKYLCKETPETLFEKGNRIPALKSEQEKPEVKDDEIIKAFADQANNGQPMPNISEVQAMWKVNDSMSLLTGGKMTPEKFAEKVVKDVKAGIEQQGK